MGSRFDAIGVTLDDEAADPLPSASQLATGTYMPTDEEPDEDLASGLFVFPPPASASSGTEKLSGFDGKNPNGPWQLWVHDDNGGDFGEFANVWSVTIKARVLR